ncbi:dihydrolipoamide dehydrogenase [Clostridium tetanomorphum]|nr:dihydrolipoamide dehydrogenase [Clostridium tetanomorphum]
MITEIKLEKLSPGTKEGKVGKVHKNIGDSIKVGDILLEVEGKKGNIPVKSKIEGKLTSIEVEEGSTVKIGDILMKLSNEDECEEFMCDKENFAVKLENRCCKKTLEGDIAIIGGGPGGYVAAIQGAKSGAKVILIEKDKVGGTCLNRGCIPTKALVRSAEVYNNVKNSEKFGIQVENYNIDMEKVLERKNRIVESLVSGIEYLLDKHKVTFIKGNGKLIDTTTLQVDEDIIVKAKNIVIATGSKTSYLPIKGAKLKNVITSEEALDLKKLPKKMVIVGGGVIGMEFAFIYANMGVEVYIVEYLIIFYRL